MIDYGDDVSIANPIVVNSDHTQLQVLSGAAEQAGDISELGGSRRLEKTGAGALLLSGNNSYSISAARCCRPARSVSAATSPPAPGDHRPGIGDRLWRRGRHRQSDHHRLR